MTPGAALLTPLTRKENYLNEIVGWGNTAPEKPLTTEELFFAAILGKAVQAPEPLTRYQMYLAKIAGRDIEIPYPETRLEYFLARAAGMDVETPVPITREEIFWSNYSAIVEFEVENVPPLTYKAIEGTLENYRIYGNTVNGESVGDRTGNLFDYSTVTNGYRITWATGVLSPDNTAIISDYIPINTGRYRSNINIVVACYDDQKKYIGVYSQNGYRKDYVPPVNDIALDNTCAYIRIFTYEQIYIQTPLSQSTMFNSGPTPLPYESYGYKVPVTVTNGTDTETTNIYLDEPLGKSGDDTDYIDYKTQKRYNIGGTSIDVTLPAIPTLPGTNTLSVGTEVQPSKVYIKGEKEREYT